MIGVTVAVLISERLLKINQRLARRRRKDDES